MLAGDKFVAETLRGLKSVILNEEIAAGVRGDGLSDQVIETVIAKQIKQRDESAELYLRGGNAERAQKEQAEKAILSNYLPEQMGSDELIEIIKAAITSTGATEQKDIGKVIASVRATVGNQADGATIAKLTKQQLA